MVIWIVGLAGAGKTTIGREVHARLGAERRGVVFLDGDHVREIMGNDLGHSLEDRVRNAWRICRLCRYLDGQGIDVVCAILAVSHETLAWNRESYSDYFEVFLDVPISVLEQRDQKGLYSGARAGRVRDVVGVDIPFAPPPASDLVLDNGAPGTVPAALAERVVAALGERVRAT